MQEKIIQYQKDTITESGTVKVSELSSQTGGDAEAGDILKGKTAWVNGVRVIGTIENKGTVNETLNAGNLYKIEPGYYSGGTIQAKDLESQTNGTARAGDILRGKTAYVKGKSVAGTMTDNSGKTVTTTGVTNDGTYTTFTIPDDGYYSSKSKVQALTENVTSDRILIQMGEYESYGAVFNVSCFSKILVTEGSAYGRVYDVDFDEHRYTNTTYWPAIYPKTGVIYNIKEEHPEAKSFYLTGKFIAYLIK